VVQLSGFVPSDADRTKAEQIAWSVEGVRGVENDIIVQP
jgi:osmotically-inducible protein OsmY